MLRLIWKQNWAVMAALFCAALFFILYPPYCLITEGPFSWHIRQAAFFQGITEAIAVFIMVFLGTLVPNNWLRTVTIGLPCLYYARRFGVDISIIALYLYIQAVFSIGWHSLPLLGFNRGTAPHKLLASAVCGIAIWSLAIWVLSSVAFHDFQTLRAALCLLLCPFLFFFRAPQLLILFRDSADSGSRGEKAIHAAYLATFLTLFAKIASSAPGYDSLWYGLSLKNMLLGKNGIYTDNGLVALVHSYPKLYEALLIPVSGFGSTSMPTGLAVYAMLFVGLTIYAILIGEGMKKPLALLVSLLAFSTPALGSIALTTKGDSFAAWMGLAAFFFLFRLHTAPTSASFWLGTTAAVFSVLARLSMLPYAGLLAISFVFYFFKGRLHRRWRDLSAKSCVIPAVAITVTFLVLLRTYLLAGVLIVAPEPLLVLQEKLGFMLKYPVGIIANREPLNQMPFIYVAWSYLFHISNFNRTLFVWVGNHWLFLSVLFLLNFRLKRLFIGRFNIFYAFTIIIFIFTFLILNYGNLGPDGNYFIFPVCCILIFTSLRLNECNFLSNKLILNIISLFIMCNIVIVFLTGLWGPGTREIDFNFSKIPFEYNDYVTRSVKSHGTEKLYSFISDVEYGDKFVGLEYFNRKHQLSFYIPACYESFRTISTWNKKIISTTNDLFYFVDKTNVIYILASKYATEQPENALSAAAFNTLQDNGTFTRVYDDDEFFILKRR